jgi:hypothetical protein
MVYRSTAIWLVPAGADEFFDLSSSWFFRMHVLLLTADESVESEFRPYLQARYRYCAWCPSPNIMAAPIWAQIAKRAFADHDPNREGFLHPWAFIRIDRVGQYIHVTIYPG